VVASQKLIRKKNFFVDSLDLSITMRNILKAFFDSNTNAPDEDLHKMFVFGIQSWAGQIRSLLWTVKGQIFVDMEGYTQQPYPIL